MATRKCILASSPKSLYEDSTLDLIIDRTCDFVASANSSLTLSDTTDDEDIQCVPESFVLTREVVGCEDLSSSVTSQPGDSRGTICPMSSSASTLCKNQTLSCNGSLKRSSKPLASSTMIENFSYLSLSSPSSQCTSSSVTEEVKDFSRPYKSLSDLHSIYMWTIHDKSQDTIFDESYVNGHHFIPNVLKTTSSSQSSMKTSCDNKEPVVTWSNSCVLVDSLSVIESSVCFSDGHNDMESIYDEDSPFKSFPSTSTKVSLGHKEDFHQVPGSSDESCEDIDQNRQEPELPPPKHSKVFKFLKTTTHLKKLFSRKRSKGKNPDKTTPRSSLHTSGSSEKQLPGNHQRKNVQLRDKKVVIKKMKKFSASMNKYDCSGFDSIQVLANL